MYKINKKVLKDENGKKVKFYGITSDNYKFEALTSNKDKIELLCSLCIRLELDEKHLPYVVEDFLNTFT